MQQTFNKSIKGHSLQFNRLLYPLRYHIINRDEESIGQVLVFHKSERGIWNVVPAEKLPKWLDDICLDIHYIIEENEKF